MSAATAKIVGFVLSLSGLAIALFYITSSRKEEYQNLVYLGLTLLLSSVILRNAVRLKPEWFKDKEKDE